MLLQRPAVVEEKLDGANVAIWLDDGRIQVALRSGATAMDRAGQRGPLRAWIAERSDSLSVLLGGDGALYAEWLYLRHTISYESLPSYLVGLDLFRPRDGFLAVDERNERLSRIDMTTPPELFRGIVGGVDQLHRLLGDSRFGAGPMEGLVIRSLDTAPRLGKLINPLYSSIDDNAWRSRRPRNRLANPASSWR
jgi:hypothetical protein